MKLVSLNTWGGKAAGIIDFFKVYEDVDIFLLQEVFYEGTERTTWSETSRKNNARLFHEIQTVLPNHQGYFAASESNEWGLAAFVHNSISVEETGNIFVHRWLDALKGQDGATLGRNLQYLKIRNESIGMMICNFHGLWNGKGKSDTEDRLKQSEKILEFIGGTDDSVILAGDFNLSPDTESLAMLEKDMRNLIKEYGITSTRTSYYEKENKFADYVLVSPGIAVKDFRVLPDEVSDHAALYLEI
jgi:exonuclease III